VVSQEQFNQHRASPLDFIGTGLDLHPILNLTDTGRLGNSRAFDLDRTHATHGDRGKAWIMTEHRDSDPELTGRVPDRCTFGYGDRAAINSEGQRFGFSGVHHGCYPYCVSDRVI
jgi:hypothetical protein